MTNLFLRHGKYQDPGKGFLHQPDLAMNLTGRHGAFGTIFEPMTERTGAELRKLADEADLLWAEWTAFRDEQERAIVPAPDFPSAMETLGSLREAMATFKAGGAR